MLLAPFLLLVTQDAPTPPPQQPTPPAPEPPSNWATSISTYWIEPPYEAGYLSAVVTADKGPLHLEAHWAYEAQDTFSLFAGKSFPIQGDLAGSVTPRVGVAGGDEQGLIPALNLELGWKKLSFYTDFEYMIGLSNDTSDFFYSWTELEWAFTDRFSAGLVGQRTHAFDQELEVDRGLMFGWTLGRTKVTGYFFNIDKDDPYFTIAVGAGF